MTKLILAKILILALFCFGQILIAQTETTLNYTSSNKGKTFVNWGGNRGDFSKSDITFKGADYNFTIQDVTAKDKPKGWHIDYINPSKITIPQTNFKLGYFFSDKYYVAIGFDHMKYVVEQDKTRKLDGFINLPAEDIGSVYNGVYNNQDFNVSADFLEFEYTDGLNYVFAEIGRQDDISSLFKIKNTDKVQININEGFSAGILYPRTNTTLLQKPRNDEFNLSGYGTALKVGLNVTFFKHFYIQTDLKGGFINMTNTRTTQSKADKATHHFFFLQRIVSVGGIFRI